VLSAHILLDDYANLQQNSPFTALSLLPTICFATKAAMMTCNKIWNLHFLDGGKLYSRMHK